MARILTIDQGNSSAKAVVWQDEVPVKAMRFFNTSVEELMPLFDDLPFDGCAFCSVRKHDAQFLESLRRLTNGELTVINSSVALPIGINYDSRATLGADRIAACAGAAALCPASAALVVDSGTALTIDILDKTSTFRGGNIAPGVSMRFNSLHEATACLPLISPEGEIPQFGHDTTTAIRAGVMEGVASEIADAFSRAKNAFQTEKIILTGNDANLLLPLLDRRGLPVMVYPELVGRGLLAIFQFNKNIYRSDNDRI